MITALNIILILIWCVAVTYLAGFALRRLIGEDERFSPAANLSYGFMAMCALFLVLAFPMTAFGAPFHILKYIWAFLVMAAAVSGVVLMVKKPADDKAAAEPVVSDAPEDKPETEPAVSDTPEEIPAEEKVEQKTAASLRMPDIFTCVVWIAAILLIIFQTGLLTCRMHVDTDDARFVAEALEAVEKDTLLRHNPINGEFNGYPVGEQIKDLTAPWPAFIATVSSLTGTHPAIMAHTVFPILFIPLSYVVFSLVGKCFFGNDLKKRGLFLLFLSVIHIFSFETIFSAGYTLLTIIWQGRSAMAMIMLPLLWYILMRFLDKDKAGVRDFALVALACLANCLMSNWGSALAFLMGGAYAMIDSIRVKSLKRALYWLIALLPAFVWAVMYIRLK